jgi:arsenite methyltransferase
MSAQAQEVKSCCAAVYSSAAARFLLGDSFHPGGAVLTAELIAALQVGPGNTVADVACGPGTSSLQLAQERGCDVVGVDLAPPPDPLDEPRVRFLQGDAEALPLPDGSVDGVLCECALCTFPDKEQAAAELVRILRPGGRLALSDVVAEQDRLPAELAGVAAWVACIADARPFPDVTALLAGAGFEIERVERRDSAFAELLDRVEARLRVAAIMDGVVSTESLEQGKTLLVAAREALADGALGYAVVIARR